QAVQRRRDRVMAMLPTLPTAAQRAILGEVAAAGQHAAPAAAVDATQPIDPERERAQTQARAEAWRLARERESEERHAAGEIAEPEGQDKPGRWRPDRPGGGGGPHSSRRRPARCPRRRPPGRAPPSSAPARCDQRRTWCGGRGA